MMILRSFIVVFHLVTLLEWGVAKDCNGQIKFYSNLSIETRCLSNIDDCSLGSLKSEFPPLFNATGWSSGKPELLNVTSYCKINPKGDNHVGLNITWRPPLHSGAANIQGFEIRLDHYGPGYRCIIIKLNEKITQTLSHSVFSGTIYPLKRRRLYTMALFSLPRSDMSGIVTKNIKSPSCDGDWVSSNWRIRPAQIGFHYNGNDRLLNVSFPAPPPLFNFSHFQLSLSSLSRMDGIKRVTINQTFHVFTSVDAGTYDLWLDIDNPHPFDEDRCKCRDDRSKCKLCVTNRKRLTLTQYVSMTTTRPRGNNTSKTTKIIIKKVFTSKRKKWKKKKPKSMKKILKYLVPTLITTVCVVLVVVIFLYFKRKSRRKANFFKTGKSVDRDTNVNSGPCLNKRVLIFVRPNGKPGGVNSYGDEFESIVRGMLGGGSIAIHKATGPADLENKLQYCVNRVHRKEAKHKNKVAAGDNECSETCLLEVKQSNKFDVPLHCCVRQVKRDGVIVVCIYADGTASCLKLLESYKCIIDNLTAKNDNIDVATLCVYPCRVDIPATTKLDMKQLSYKDDLSTILSYLKEHLYELKSDKNEEPEKVTVKKETRVMTNYTQDIDDWSLELISNTDHHSDGEWRDGPGVVQIPRTQCTEMPKRSRYVSSDSGWCASDSSFRSTSIKEKNKTSSRSSLHSASVTDNDSLSPLRPETFKIIKSIGTPQLSPSLPKPLPLSTRLAINHLVSKCPSDVFFFPPDEFDDISNDPHTVDNGRRIGSEGQHAAEKMIEDYVDVTPENNEERLVKFKCVPFSNNNSVVEVKCKSGGRNSPSMNSLMDMLKAINDESMHYMEHEASIGEVHSVFEGVV